MMKIIVIFSLFLFMGNAFAYNVTLHNAYGSPIVARAAFRDTNGEGRPYSANIARGETATIAQGLESRDKCLQWVDIRDAQGNLLDVWVASPISTMFHVADNFFFGNYDNATKKITLAAAQKPGPDFKRNGAYIRTTNTVDRDAIITNLACGTWDWDMNFVLSSNRKLALLIGDKNSATEVYMTNKIQQLADALKDDVLFDKIHEAFGSAINLDEVYIEGRERSGIECNREPAHCEKIGPGGEMTLFAKAIEMNNMPRVKWFLQRSDIEFDKPLNRFTGGDIDPGAYEENRDKKFIKYPIDFATSDEMKRLLTPVVKSRKEMKK